MKKGLLLAASCAFVMSSMGSAHAMQSMTGNELREVSGQALPFEIKWQNPSVSFTIESRKYRLVDLLPHIDLGLRSPVEIGVKHINFPFFAILPVLGFCDWFHHGTPPTPPPPTLPIGRPTPPHGHG